MTARRHQDAPQGLREMIDPDLEDHDLGLVHDLPLLSRRRALGLFGGVSLAASLAACGASSDSRATSSTSDAGSASAASTGDTSTSTSSSDASSGDTIPEETGGPYPGDGSNGPNVLTESGIVRSDITSSFGDATGSAAGVPTTITLKVVNVEKAESYAGAAVYLWHCDNQGRYSMYSDGITEENFLRGVQEADADGKVTFSSFYPAAYSGRWPHIHFEVYPSLEDATSASNKLRTSQVALPEAASRKVYATDEYSDSLQNLSQVTLATDNVFSDGWSLEMGTVTGNVDDGMKVTLNVPV